MPISPALALKISSSRRAANGSRTAQEPCVCSLPKHADMGNYREAIPSILDRQIDHS